MFRRNLTFLLAAAGICLMGCQDELINKENGQPATGKNAISFTTGGIGEFEPGEGEGQSRTAYGTGTIGNDGKWHCPLDWVYGDRVRVYCDEASADTHADYSVVWDNGQEGQVQGSQNRAYLQTTGNTLCWGDPSKAHTFYAFYPATMIQEDADALGSGIIKGEIPNTQNPEWSYNAKEKKWTGKPDMNYAFMRAETTVAPEKVGDAVELRFKPLTTAVQISLNISEDLTLSESKKSYLSNIIIEAPDRADFQQALCGHFEYDLKKGETELTDLTTETTNRQISINLLNEDGQPIEIHAGDKIEFTVFLLPGINTDGTREIRNLKINVMGFGVSGVWSCEWSDAEIKVGTVNHVELEGYSTNGGSYDWMAVLDDNIKLSQLSIPGATSAFTRDITFGSSYQYTPGTEQDVRQWFRAAPGSDIRDEKSLFNQGVRAFEVAATVEKKTVGNYAWGNKKLILTAGKMETSGSGWDFSSAVKQLAAELVHHPTEFAVLIPYFEEKGDEQSILGENVDGWVEALTSYIRYLMLEEPFSIEIEPFDGSKTVGEVRGKILVLSRYADTMTDLNNGDYGNLNIDQVKKAASFICEWDLDRDRWYKRGYLIDDIMNTIDGTKMWYEVSSEKEEWQWTGKQNVVFEPSTQPTKKFDYDNTKWTYDVSIYNSGNDNNSYHVFDWERVCEEEGRYNHQYNTSYVSHWYNTYWYESKSEKLRLAKLFMDDAIAGLNADPSGKNVYINSLRGYYIVSDENGLSAAPWGINQTPDAGLHGDIPAHAQDINKELYNHIINKEYAARGPLGIILMDFAGVDNEVYQLYHLHGDKLLNAIIDNNFRFLLQTAASDAE